MVTAPTAHQSASTRSTASSGLPSSGVTTQRRPWNRSARAAPAPCFSDPATGWLPTSTIPGCAAATRRQNSPFVLPMSVTTASGASAPAISSANAMFASTGAASTTSDAPATASAGVGAMASTAPRSSAVRAFAGEWL